MTLSLCLLAASNRTGVKSPRPMAGNANGIGLGCRNLTAWILSQARSADLGEVARTAGPGRKGIDLVAP